MNKKMIEMLKQTNQISQFEDNTVRNELFEKFGLSRIGSFESTARGELSNDLDILIDWTTMKKNKVVRIIDADHLVR